MTAISHARAGRCDPGASSAVALVTFLVAHRAVAVLRRHGRVVRLIDHPRFDECAGDERERPT